MAFREVLIANGPPFVPLPAMLRLQRVGGGEAGGAIEPAGQHRARTEGTGLAREDDKNRLRDFLRQMRVADPPQRG